MSNYKLIERCPTAGEYKYLIRSVGWRRRDNAAIETAFANTLYAICAEADGKCVGCGRVIGDEGLYYYISDLIVLPEFQRQGIGGSIMDRLNAWLEALPFKNTSVSLIPTKGLREFYEGKGFVALKQHSPAMWRWLNEEV